MCRVTKGTCWTIVSWRLAYSRLGIHLPVVKLQRKYLHNVWMSLVGVFLWNLFYELGFHLWINEYFILTFQRFRNKKENQVWKRTWSFPLLVWGTCGDLGGIESSYWTPGCLAFVPSIWVVGNLLPSLEISLTTRGQGGWDLYLINQEFLFFFKVYSWHSFRMIFLGYSKLIRNSQTWVDISGPLCQKKMWRKEVQENLIFLF